MSDFLIFEVDCQAFALSTANVERVIDTPPLTTMPAATAHMRGVIKHMGKAIPLYDFRRTIGKESYHDELTGLIADLQRRKEDHLNWLGRLKESVTNKQEITVETNPHKCAFGKWYDSFRHESVNITHYFARFDKPHREIHRVAVTAKELIARGEATAAEALIRKTEEGVLAALVKLFDGAEETLRRFSSDYTIIVQDSSKTTAAIAVDSVKTFKRLAAEKISALPETKRGNSVFVDRIFLEDDEAVLIVNLDTFVTDTLC